ncbi:dihydropteroate synthase [Arsenicibacter rosenii]|uniref:dihydropteroate synthase n=1 Tax=Arsenicibacter rosenii TaxID=1750698 RepID=A0A1S2VIC8_9BACT|nr:dihydropteroate synthase [Arsenicibacter rosenii]OIN57608.1 dihydropteroate synthase [Arsenicibacter rosenii]
MPKVTKKTLNCRGRLVNLADGPTPDTSIMGILNLTPDSFYEHSRMKPEKVADAAIQMIREGARFIDIGGYSTRPGAADISPAEEADRVLPAIEAILTALPDALISVDTFRASVARQAVEAGAVMVNDVAGGTLDPDMFATVTQLGVPYVLMHMRGTPQTMQSYTAYQDLVPEVIDEIGQQYARLQQLGHKDIILDPGFGFAKTPAQNFELLEKLDAFRVFDAPVLVGLSRKSTIWRTLGITAAEALNGTTVLNTIAVLKQADIIRVHDVREAAEVILLKKNLKKIQTGYCVI